MGRAGMLGNFVNKFDGGVEILDDLDDHWTAKHHKGERNWFIQELQEIAAEKSVRVTILGGDVHLGAVGQFFSNSKLDIPKDRDHRYMPNVISSAIVNTPPPDMMADVLNKRNKIHHLDEETDENMIPMFPHDIDGKPRNNKHLLPRRNWCSIREYIPADTPVGTPSGSRSPSLSPGDPGKLKRRLSDRVPGAKLVRRLSQGGEKSVSHPPVTFSTQNYGRFFPSQGPEGNENEQRLSIISRFSHSGSSSRRSSLGAAPPSSSEGQRPNIFLRRPSSFSAKGSLNDDRDGHINLEHGLEIVLNVEVNQKDPAGITTPYRLLVPALDYSGIPDENSIKHAKQVGILNGFLARSSSKRRSWRKSFTRGESDYDDDTEWVSQDALTPQLHEQQPQAPQPLRPRSKIPVHPAQEQETFEVKPPVPTRSPHREEKQKMQPQLQQPHQEQYEAQTYDHQDFNQPVQPPHIERSAPPAAARPPRPPRPRRPSETEQQSIAHPVFAPAKAVMSGGLDSGRQPHRRSTSNPVHQQHPRQQRHQHPQYPQQPHHPHQSRRPQQPQYPQQPHQPHQSHQPKRPHQHAQYQRYEQHPLENPPAQRHPSVRSQHQPPPRPDRGGAPPVMSPTYVQQRGDRYDTDPSYGYNAPHADNSRRATYEDNDEDYNTVGLGDEGDYYSDEDGSDGLSPVSPYAKQHKRKSWRFWTG